jgi:Arylsulfotransferase (ASST)
LCFDATDPGGERAWSVDTRSRTLTRRHVLQGAAGAAAGLAVAGEALAAPRPGPWHGADPTLPSRLTGRIGTAVEVRSIPDFRPPVVNVGEGNVAPGYLFMAPQMAATSQSGAMIVDGTGQPVWFNPVVSPDWVANFQLTTYRNEPMIQWWHGVSVLTGNGPTGFGVGRGVIADRSYREVGRVVAANGRTLDMHELQVTPEGTALFMCTPQSVAMDLTEVGGPRDGQVLEAVIQEVEISSGKLLMEWHSLDHIGVSESYLPFKGPYDYLHANSIDVTPDGNLLVSGRHTWTLYKIDRRSGHVMWRMGGRRSNFEIERAARWAWQHDARQVAHGVITLFDDASDGFSKNEAKQSRGVKLEVDWAHRRVKLGAQYVRPRPLLAAEMGNVQTLPDGHLIVSWGNTGVLSEFGADETWITDASMRCLTYRAFRFPWTGIPAIPPALTAGRLGKLGNVTLYASWNGDTRTVYWRVFTGSSSARLRPVGIATRRGFETAILVPSPRRYLAVAALDAWRRQLSRSEPIQI